MINKKSQINPKYYLVLGNHYSLTGNWEQVLITIRTFSKLSIELNFSMKTVPGEINIFIEEFSKKIADDTIAVCNKHPNTKVIMYVTEYLSKNTKKFIYLNCFTKKDFIKRAFYRYAYPFYESEIVWEPRPTLSLLDVLKIKFRKILDKFVDNSANERMLTRRGFGLAKLKKHVSLCISTTEEVLKTYDKVFGCKLCYLPVFVDTSILDKKIKEHQTQNVGFFSGNLTKYRQKKLTEVHQKIISSSPLYLQSQFPTDSPDNVETRLKLGSILDRADEQIKWFVNSLKTAKPIEIIQKIKDVNPNFLFEIYIPQAEGWLYSSPNRTLLSLEKGFVPFNFGVFTDHEICEVAYQGDIDLLFTLFMKNPKEILIATRDKCFKYNIGQEKRALKIKEELLNLLH